MIFQLRVDAYDTAVPTQRTTSDVTIFVSRNVNNPQFTNQRFQNRIPESYGLGQAVLTVTANDNDGVSIKFAVF